MSQIPLQTSGLEYSSIAPSESYYSQSDQAELNRHPEIETDDIADLIQDLGLGPR